MCLGFQDWQNYKMKDCVQRKNIFGIALTEDLKIFFPESLRRYQDHYSESLWSEVQQPYTHNMKQNEKGDFFVICSFLYSQRMNTSKSSKLFEKLKSRTGRMHEE